MIGVYRTDLDGGWRVPDWLDLLGMVASAVPGDVVDDAIGDGQRRSAIASRGGSRAAGVVWTRVR